MFGKKSIDEKNDNQFQTDGSTGGARPADQIREKGVVIHSMPENFRFSGGGSSSAKNFGLLILIGGTILIIISLVLLYFFVYKDGFNKTLIINEIPEKTTGNSIEKKTEPVKKEEPAVATTSSGLMIDEELGGAVINATTTEEQAENQILPENREAEDSDNDGLFDKEEILLGANIDQIDSDGDDYDDLSELANLYNPAGGGKLTANKGVSEYTNSFLGYSLLYPTEWMPDRSSGDDYIVFSSPDNQFIQIISQDNQEKLSIEEWIDRGEFPSSAGKIQADTWQGMMAEDGLTAYITDIGRERVFIITYSLGVGSSFDYRNIFNMVVKSFAVKR